MSSTYYVVDSQAVQQNSVAVRADPLHLEAVSAVDIQQVAPHCYRLPEKARERKRNEVFHRRTQQLLLLQP